MKKTGKIASLIGGCLLVASLFVNVGCSENTAGEEIPAGALALEWVSDVKEDVPVVLFPGGETSLAFKVENAKTVSVGEVPENWEVALDEAASVLKIKAPAEGVNSSFELLLLAKGTDDTEQEIKVKIVYMASWDDPKGTFVLNEGNMTTENGSLDYITPEGLVIEDVYKAVNGTELGNVCQDMAFHNGKIYIISQNGDENPQGTKFENDGMLVILDAKTLKKEKTFRKEDLSELYWPTHIAVLDENHVYIRDNKDNQGAIWRLNPATGELVLVEGSEGAPQTPFVVKDGKVYTFKNSSVLIKLWSMDVSSDRISSQNLPMNLKEVYQIQDAGDNHIWVLGTNSAPGNPTIVIKADLSDPSDRKAPYRTLHVLPSPQWNTSGCYFASFGNTIYYNESTGIYRISFDGEESESQELVDLYDMDDNAKELYNGMRVNPETGCLYVNTIKGAGPFYTHNAIWVYDVNGDWSAPKYKLENHTAFPAGFFFYR